MRSLDKRFLQELRWDPVLGEWVMVSSTRKQRPWQPESFCPFCPGSPETGFGWDVLILENRYPMLSEDAPEPEKHSFYRKSRAVGRCYVVVETPQHEVEDLSDLSIEHLERVLRVIINKMREESKREYAVYFLWFRNKGREIGVSLTHPHSQIYVTPFIPSKIERELANSEKYYRDRGRCLFCDIIEVEKRDRIRVLLENESFIVFMPFYSHWPFEAHIYPKRHVQLLTELENSEIRDLATTLKNTLCGFKNLFKNKSTPYIMVLHQAPLKGEYKFYHMHIEIYGLLREENKLKYAAGMEMGGGNFTYDSIPEENAFLLRGSIEECSEKLR